MQRGPARSSPKGCNSCRIEPFNQEQAMRVISIIGIVLVLAGGWVTINGGSFTTREKVVEVGDLAITADRERPIPLWAGIGAMLLGAGMIVAGLQKR